MTSSGAPGYKNHFYDSSDGLKLYTRHYQNSGAPTLLCLHGLTRNSADFEPAAQYLAKDFELIIPDQRGRGYSDYDPDPSRYRPDIYAGDMLGLLAAMQKEKIIILGTSMGGIMAMIMAALSPGLIQGIILNDIGPEIDAAGLERIKGYVGGADNFPNWDAAATAIASTNRAAFPHYDRNDWIAFAKRCCHEHQGHISFAYDPQIAAPFKDSDEAAAPLDMWPLFAQLSDYPILVIRGALSDILSQTSYETMLERHSQARGAVISRVGHAPMLDEPEAISALTQFLSQIAP